MTGNSGIFIFPNIPITTYNLAVSANGFQSYEQTGIVLEVGSSIAINPSLKVGGPTSKLKYRPKASHFKLRMSPFKQTID